MFPEGTLRALRGCLVLFKSLLKQLIFHILLPKPSLFHYIYFLMQITKQIFVNLNTKL